MIPDFKSQFFLNNGTGGLRFSRSHGKAERVLGRCLRHNKDVDVLGGQGAENPFTQTGDANQSPTLNAEKHNVIDG